MIKFKIKPKDSLRADFNSLEKVVCREAIYSPLQGHISTVYKICQPQTGETWVEKFTEQKYQQLAQNEAEVLQVLAGCPGIPLILGVQKVLRQNRAGNYRDRGQVFTILRMEYVPGDELTNLIWAENARENLVTMSYLLKEILPGLQQAKVVHRDIKPQNIIVSNGRPWLVDFGLAKLDGAMDIAKPHDVFGTIGYMSPEQAKGKTTDFNSDLFSSAMVVYDIILGRSPLNPSFNHRGMITSEAYSIELEKTIKFSRQDLDRLEISLSDKGYSLDFRTALRLAAAPDPGQRQSQPLTNELVKIRNSHG